jgi:Zn-dependent alcohol dehydrogenase
MKIAVDLANKKMKQNTVYGITDILSKSKLYKIKAYIVHMEKSQITKNSIHKVISSIALEVRRFLILLACMNQND